MNIYCDTQKYSQYVLHELFYLLNSWAEDAKIDVGILFYTETRTA